MRYGKKLALLSQSSAHKGIERPMISHRQLKAILSKIARCLKSNTDLECIPGLVNEFTHTLSSDLVFLVEFVQREEAGIARQIDELEQQGVALGIVGSDVLEKLVVAIENALVSPCLGLHHTAGEHLKNTWISLTMEIALFADKFNATCISLQSLLSYADLNVAGFRKLVKQFGKQVPLSFRAEVVTVDHYRRLVTGLLSLVRSITPLRERTEELMQKLSPGAPPLNSFKIGSETLAATEETSATKFNERSIASTAPASPSLREIPDFASLMSGGSINLENLQSKLFDL